jgi:riboflavin kinase/FMN adenylyltransferase
MRVLHGLDGLRQVAAGAVVSVGNFDGLHLGHQRILRKARELATAQGAALVVVTFEPHPLTVLRPEQAPPRLTPPEIKQPLIQAAGADDLVLLAPRPDVLGLSAREFWEILRVDLRVAHLVEGASFRFGKGAAGTIETLRVFSAATDVKLHVVESVAVPLLDLHVAPVSSSLIRFFLSFGRVRDAAICLGRSYVLQGVIVKGMGRGRTLGVPTANLQCQDQMIPADAVYAGRCTLDGRSFPAAVNIGSAPTFDAQVRQIEAHVIGFDGDLYGRTLGVELLDWLRDQRKFAGAESLKAQLARDIARTTAWVGKDASRPIALAQVSKDPAVA